MYYAYVKRHDRTHRNNWPAVHATISYSCALSVRSPVFIKKCQYMFGCELTNIGPTNYSAIMDIARHYTHARTHGGNARSDTNTFKHRYGLRMPFRAHALIIHLKKLILLEVRGYQP